MGVGVWVWVWVYIHIFPLFSRASKNLPPPITKTMLTKCHSHSLSLSPCIYINIRSLICLIFCLIYSLTPSLISPLYVPISYPDTKPPLQLSTRARVTKKESPVQTLGVQTRARLHVQGLQMPGIARPLTKRGGHRQCPASDEVRGCGRTKWGRDNFSCNVHAKKQTYRGRLIEGHSIQN